eukprot:TRINITY_DN25934_c0_g1_i1.p1 TRINITY_DN25934_c0_g1~~TRINITY_DN25934_c0_g1_i1.p1  ORF type:complete len:139 (+),score=23.52 TRINITY_DN25934_c0_g1_i1:164-580(+)
MKILHLITATAACMATAHYFRKKEELELRFLSMPIVGPMFGMYQHRKALEQKRYKEYQGERPHLLSSITVPPSQLKAVTTQTAERAGSRIKDWYTTTIRKESLDVVAYQFLILEPALSAVCVVTALSWLGGTVIDDNK